RRATRGSDGGAPGTRRDRDQPDPRPRARRGGGGCTDTGGGVMADMQMRTEGPIRTRHEGCILEVTLDRPKANAIDLATSRIMGLVFRDFRDDESLRVAILRAEGEKFFCPGWDLKAAAAGDAVDGDY